jgi:hypothetical protein
MQAALYPSFENCYSDEAVEAFRASVMFLLGIDLRESFERSELKQNVFTLSCYEGGGAVYTPPAEPPAHLSIRPLADSFEDAFGADLFARTLVAVGEFTEWSSSTRSQLRPPKKTAPWKRLKLSRALLRLARGFFGTTKVDGRNAP